MRKRERHNWHLKTVILLLLFGGSCHVFSQTINVLNQENKAGIDQVFVYNKSKTITRDDVRRKLDDDRKDSGGPQNPDVPF